MKISAVFVVLAAFASTAAWAFPYPMARGAFICKYFVEVTDKTPKWVLENPLLRFSDLPFGAIPLELIEVRHLEPAFKVAFAESKKRVEAILANQEEPTFENTIEAMGKAFASADLALYVLSHFEAAHDTSEIQRISAFWTQKFQVLESSMSLNPDLLKRIATLKDRAASLPLAADQKRLLDLTYEGMVDNGAALSSDTRAQITEIESELTALSIRYRSNLATSARENALYLSDDTQLSGVPKPLIDHAKAAALKANLGDGYLISADINTYSAFSGVCDDPALRKQLYERFAKSATQGETNNLEVALKIAQLKSKLSHLRGFNNFAEFTLKDRLAKDPATVRGFLEVLAKQYLSAAKQEKAELEVFAGHKLAASDIRYYSEKYKAKNYTLDQETIRKYFRLEKVLQGAMNVAKSLYKISFNHRSDLSFDSPKTDVFEVTDDVTGEELGLLYVDPYRRVGKATSAHKRDLQPAGLFFGQNRRPHVMISLTLNDPGETPSLLDPREVRTLFHEFGHALHSLLSQGRYTSLLGTRVARDLVELPSQIYERWAFEPEVLKTYARHHKTGKALPQKYLTALNASQNFQAGMNGLGQVRFALLDLTWHDGSRPLPTEADAILEWEKSLLSAWSLDDRYQNTVSQRFGHVFEGGYAAGYYSYKWSEVLAASAFRPFREHGLFNQEWAKRFRETILERGNQEEAAELFRRYLGKDPDPNDLLREEGLL